MAITHAFVSAKQDGTDTSIVRPSDWNADHVYPNDHAAHSDDQDLSGKVDKATGYALSKNDLSDALKTDYDSAVTLKHSNSLDHANTNDPASGEKSALAGTSGTPGTGNKYVTDGDTRNTNARTPTTHSHVPGDVTGTAVVTADSRLSDARTPTAHVTSHKSGGSDAIKLDELGTGTDVTTLNADATKHGLLCKTPGNTTTFLRGDNTFATPPATGIGYAINVQALTSSPTDAQTIYFGNMPKAPTTTAATSKVYIRKAGTLKVAEIYCYSGTAGTNESWSLYVRLNNTTDTLIATLGVSASERLFTNAALSIAVVSGDYIEIKSINPTWATNPLTTIFGGYIYIE